MDEEFEEDEVVAPQIDVALLARDPEGMAESIKSLWEIVAAQQNALRNFTGGNELLEIIKILIDRVNTLEERLDAK